MNKQQTLQSLSNVTKTYMRISQLKTVLTVFFVGYTLTKIIKTMRSSNWTTHSLYIFCLFFFAVVQDAINNCYSKFHRQIH